MGKHDRHQTGSYEKVWDNRSAPESKGQPDTPAPAGKPDAEAELDEDEAAGGVHPSFAREIRIGLAVLGALLLVLVVVVWSRLRRGDETPPADKLAAAQPSEAQAAPAGVTSGAGTKAPRELTATEPKQPLAPPRPVTGTAGQPPPFASDSAGPSTGNPFGVGGGPSFMPKVAKNAPAAATRASGVGRTAPGFARSESFPPEPPGEAITVGEGPIDPFRHRTGGVGASTGSLAAASPSAPAALVPGLATGGVSSATAGSNRNSPNPLRTEHPPVGPATDAGVGLRAFSAGEAASRQTSGPSIAGPQPTAAAQGSGLFAAAQPGGPAAFGVAGAAAGRLESATDPNVLADTQRSFGAATAPSGPAATSAMPASAMPATSAPLRQGSRVYVVREGETLYDIARNALGKASRWGEIYDLNWDQLGNRVDGLVPGMKLLLPDDGGQPTGGLSRNPSPPGANPSFHR